MSPASAADDQEARMHESRAALICGSRPLMRKAFPDRWDRWQQEQQEHAIAQVFEDITSASGYIFTEVCIEPSESYEHWKPAFDAFGKEHKMETSSIVFHGSSREAVLAIHAEGFDPERVRMVHHGRGPYVTHDLFEALAFAEPDENGVLWVVYGRAHLGDPQDIPVGIDGQTDFGVRADGAPIVTLTNPTRIYWCLSDPKRQFISNGFMGFRVKMDERPSDFALIHMCYTPAVWDEMKARLPGLAAYKRRLLAAQHCTQS